MKDQPAKALWKVKPYRRLIQLLVLVGLVVIPFASQNPMEWAPSRILQGQIPAPTTLNVAGDTWSLDLFGISLAHPLALIDNWCSVHVIYLPLLMAALLPLALTVLFGRIFCSWVCPVGFLLELNMGVRRLLVRPGSAGKFTLPDIRYTVLAACLVFAFFLAIPILSVFDPPHTLGRELMSLFTHHTASFAGMALLLGLLFADTFVSARACCSKLCPSGGGLSLLGKFRLLRINLNREKCIECGNCNASCPYALHPMSLAHDRDFDWTKCDNCGLCRDSCPTGAIEYGLRQAEKNNR